MREDPNSSQTNTNFKIFATEKKIIVYFFLIVIVIFFMFNSLFYRLYASNIRQIVIQESRSNVKKTVEYTDMIVEGMEYTADVIQNNQLIQQQVDPSQRSSTPSYRINPDIISTLQSIVTNSVKSAASIDLYLNVNNKLYTSDYGVFSYLNTEKKNYFYKLQIQDGRFVLTNKYRQNINFIKDRNYEQITFVRPIYVLSNGNRAGTLAVNFDKYYLSNIIKSDSEAGSMILDSEGNIVASSVPEGKGYPQNIEKEIKKLVKAEKGEGLQKVSNGEYIIVYDTSQYTGWKFVNFVPANTTMKQMAQLRDYILVLFLIMNVITASLFIVLMSGKIYRKLKKLIYAMKEVEKGNFGINIEHHEKDEFGYMYTSFNNMVGRIKNLFGELYEQKLLQKDAELKLLQSKINPHFIYNIFDNMNWLIQLERYQELEVLVGSVSDYFKKSLNAGRDFISVADMLEQLKSYVQIQRIRFSNRFTCEFDFDDEIIDMNIPNFMMQPLLENAICHGIEPKAEESRIQVKGVRIEDRVFFTVEDDGVGIDQENIQKIIVFLESMEAESGNYFALANINKRIKLYYGAEYGLTVRSTRGAGTKVTIIIPFKKISENY
ncbi:sensor histidine kinase [Ruminiclostridium cellobioparum]|uniref:histidine kinase n=1 Tax=Ruminiclostridium cellobioparum subsp. termitidis CT1112 TaxID=1195236 RepID=S0FS03_RUMCE|nr:sensor histidine kinase [Ruminiclostridium cellobioparum]EMS73126.1 multi-sensor signal transduction histidine kinase [Ruminiclostridium cellobioparum subsp. termitidis CT1112]